MNVASMKRNIALNVQRCVMPVQLNAGEW